MCLGGARTFLNTLGLYLFTEAMSSSSDDSEEVTSCLDPYAYDPLPPSNVLCMESESTQETENLEGDW